MHQLIIGSLFFFSALSFGGEKELDLASGLVPLIIVLAVVLISAYIFKSIKGSIFPISQDLKILHQVPIGQKERIIIVEADGKRLLVGVTPQSINLISHLDTLDRDET